MKKLLATLLLSAIALTSVGLVSAHAEGVSRSNYFKVEGAKLGAKQLTAQQIKFAQKKAKAFPHFLEVSCWANVGAQVSTAQRKTASNIAKELCKILRAANSDLDIDLVSTYQPDEYGAKQYDLYFSISDPRTISFDGAYTNGDFPDSPAPVGFNKIITVPGNTRNLENYELAFLGWTKSNEGKGKVFVAGDKITMKKPFYLHPKWDGYDVSVTVTDIGQVGLGHVGFNYESPYSSQFKSELLGLVSGETFEIGGNDGSEQIWFTAPGNAPSNSLSVSGDIAVDFRGGATCGWALDYQQCTIWYLTVTGDGTVTYDLQPN